MEQVGKLKRQKIDSEWYMIGLLFDTFKTIPCVEENKDLQPSLKNIETIIEQNIMYNEDYDFNYITDTEMYYLGYDETMERRVKINEKTYYTNTKN